MKTFVPLFLLVLSAYTQGVELRPYSGVVYSYKWGLQTGADIAFPLKKDFCFQTGLMFYSNPRLTKSRYSYDDWRMGVNLPIYIQYCLPVSNKLKMNINVGPYLGIAFVGQIGISSKISIDISKVNVGINYFKNCVTDKFSVLGLSVGYRFDLRKRKN